MNEYSQESNYIGNEDFLRLRKRVRKKSKLAYEELVAVINRGNYVPRANIKALFKEVDDPAIVPIITTQLFYQNEGQGAKDLIDKLGEFDTKHVQKPLIKLIKSPNPSIRISALRSLAMLSDTRIYEVVVELLEDPSPEVRDAAYDILAYQYIPEIVPFIIQALQDIRFFIIYKRPLAAKLLGLFPDKRAIEPLINALDDEQSETRTCAIESLALYNTPEVEQALENVLHTDNTSEALAAAKSLHVFQNPNAIIYLTKALLNKYTADRLEVISVLGTFNDKKIVPPLTKQLLHSSVEVRDAAREALLNQSTLHNLGPFLDILEMCDDEVLTSHVLYLTSLYLEGDHHLAKLLAGVFYSRNPYWNKFMEELDLLPSLGEWRHLPFFARVNLADTMLDTFQVVRLKMLLKGHTNRLKKDRNVLLCKEHLTRFIKVQGDYLSYHACRICKKLSTKMHAKYVVAVVDHDMKTSRLSYGDTYRINWFEHKTMFDFDIVEIGACTEEEITSFCIELGNDSDPYRAKRHKNIVCHVVRNNGLSQAALRRLQVSFDTVKFIRLPQASGT